MAASTSDRSGAAPRGADAFVHPAARLGAGVSLGPRAYVGEGAVLGDGCDVGAGAYVGAGVTLGAGVRVEACAVLSGGGPPGAAGRGTVVGDGVTVGANSTVAPGVVIDARAEVRPGAVVTRAVPPTAIVEGNPASIVGYVDVERRPDAGAAPRAEAVEATAVRGVTLHELRVVTDLRGNLTVGEFERQIPFAPRRYFLVFDVPSREVRGEHAHKECHQFLVCVRGSCSVIADDGARRVELSLDAPNRGLYLPPMTWGIQYRYTADAALLVFASHHYDPADYIRDYGEFRAAVARR